MLNPAQFIREVRQEMVKVTWPTRKETMISTVMVLLLAGFAAVFFLTVDWVLATLIRLVLGMGA